ncbi:hypothetical protein MSAN_02493600 [Mycena sanguinolenta]|uniref:Uncharacterized protein n=1 Tax=Mycena sanguinolenta TaxID=230812 RepID=A0A8H6WU48_9AGAR|nr:hypothetical protein MSAN_02493600 [Mycena sanguinolenta]
MKRIFGEIQSFRLGYTEERPYPWRWTTPIVLCAFFLMTPFLTLVNVPLSAYNIVQDCDVVNITVQLLLSLSEVSEIGWVPQVQFGGTIACYLPTPFYLTWGGIVAPTIPWGSGIRLSSHEHGISRWRAAWKR